MLFSQPAKRHGRAKKARNKMLHPILSFGLNSVQAGKKSASQGAGNTKEERK